MSCRLLLIMEGRKKARSSWRFESNARFRRQRTSVAQRNIWWMIQVSRSPWRCYIRQRVILRGRPRSGAVWRHSRPERFSARQTAASLVKYLRGETEEVVCGRARGHSGPITAVGQRWFGCAESHDRAFGLSQLWLHWQMGKMSCSGRSRSEEGACNGTSGS
jgi:hypothetical protein